MIKINFLSSPDSEIIGYYTSYKNTIIIGYKLLKKNNIIINDSEIESSHLTIILNINGPLISNNNPSNSYLYNGKKIVGTKRAIVEDKITIGKTTFEIEHYEFISTPSFQKKLEFNFAKVKKKMPEVTLIIKELAKEMLKVKTRLKAKKN